MVDRAQPLRSWPGVAAAVGVATLVLGSLAAVFLVAEPGRGFGVSEWAAVRFTLIQSSLSAVISVAFSVPVARALARRRFRGRQAMITLLGAPFILPVIVAILGLLAVFGRSGWISTGLSMLGLPPLQIYGLHGVVLAHVFFNLPLATRLILQGWQEIPAERFRLAAQLNAGPRAMWRLLERPMLARYVPGILVTVFAICLTSFAVALTLGGGPRATTIELAIYQAFRFDFDLSRAALLSCVQIGLTASVAWVALRIASQAGFGRGQDLPVKRWDDFGPGRAMLDGLAISIAAVFLLLPLIAVIFAGAPSLLFLPGSVYNAALNSVLVAVASTGCVLLLAAPMAAAAAAGRAKAVELVGLLGLAASPLVLGTGLFVVIYPFADPTMLALPVTALVNSVMALPFALRILVPAVRDVAEVHGRLGLSLNMQGWSFARLILLPRIRPQIGFAAGLTAALSIGDLGVIALFADPETATLPLQIYRLMGAYRMEAAQGAALLLLVVAMGLFWFLDCWGRWHVEA